jgi:hypothetical protein
VPVGLRTFAENHDAPKIDTLPGGLLLTATRQAQVRLSSTDPQVRYDLIHPGHRFARVAMYDSSGRKTLEFVNENVITREWTTGRLTFIRYRQAPRGRFGFDTSVISPEPVRITLSTLCKL